MGNERKFFSSSSLVAFARESVVVRAFITGEGYLDQCVVLAFCVIGEAIVQVRFNNRRLEGVVTSQGRPTPIGQATEFIQSMEKEYGKHVSVTPGFLYENVQVVAARIVTKPNLEVVRVSPSVIQLLPIYGALDQTHNTVFSALHSGCASHEQKTIDEFRRRFSRFTNDMISEASRNLRALVR